jgi:hypothetical protein
MRQRGGVRLRGHDPGDGEEAGPCLRLSKQFRNRDSANFAMRLSEKGSEQRSEGGFGRYEEAERGRKEPSGRSVGLRHGYQKDFSDSLITQF